jgi:hypothetical protein
LLVFRAQPNSILRVSVSHLVLSRIYAFALVCFLFTTHVLTGTEPGLWNINGRLIDYKGLPAAHFTIRARAWVQGESFDLSTVTDVNGDYHFKVPKGTWRIEADPDELVARGFFCVPVMIICETPGNCPPSGGIFPGPIWTINLPGDFITIEPVRIVPLAPTLSPPTIAENGNVTFQLKFDTTFLPLETVRTYRVEASADFGIWTPVSTNELRVSPIVITEQLSNPGLQRYYRAVMIDSETLL